LRRYSLTSSEAPASTSTIPSQTLTSTLTATPTKRPTATSTSSAIPTSTATITPTPDFAKYAGIWKEYHNEVYGFTFEYPAIFTDPAYHSCDVTVLPGWTPEAIVITLGWLSDLIIKEANGLTAEEYIDQQTQPRESDGDWTNVTKSYQPVAGIDATTVEYRFGGLSRYGTATALRHRNFLFIFNLTAGIGCYIPEVQVDEVQAYFHMIESFRFDR